MRVIWRRGSVNVSYRVWRRGECELYGMEAK